MAIGGGKRGFLFKIGFLLKKSWYIYVPIPRFKRRFRTLRAKNNNLLAKYENLPKNKKSPGI
jgi:hypothetical protein